MTIAEVQTTITNLYNNFINSEFVTEVSSWSGRQVEWLQSTASIYYPKFLEAIENLRKTAEPHLDLMVNFVKTHNVMVIGTASTLALTFILVRYFSSENKEESLGFSKQVPSREIAY